MTAESVPAGFDLWRQRSGFVLAPVALVATWQLTGSLAPAAHRLAAILAAVVVLWVTEAIPMAVTAFAAVSGAVALQVAPATEAFAAFADQLIFVFIGTFMLARAIGYHGLDRRFALALLRLPGVERHPGRLLAVYAAVACVVSMLIDSAATTAMMLPIALVLLAAMGEPARHGRFATAILLLTAFASTVGGLATPVGAAPNLIGLGFIRRELGTSLSFFAWMTLGVPVVALLFAWLVLHLARGTNADPAALSRLVRLVDVERASLGPWTRGQLNTLIACGVTVVLWLVPGAVGLLAGADDPLARQLQAVLPESVAAMVGTTLLFVLPVDVRAHRFTLPWDEAARIDWWIVFLYGGGIALGTLAFRTGLAGAMGRTLTTSLGVRSGLGLLILSTAVATLLSETTSNTAAANMVVPVVIACARSAGSIRSCQRSARPWARPSGSCLPVSTPANAIVYGAGHVPLGAMMRGGLALDLVGIAVIVLVLSTLGPAVLGVSTP
jgi:sodium-dependent dicarboxylate transporter 2/3/5